MKETRMSRIFTMVFDAYNPHEAVGFNIKGVRHLFEEIGLATKGVHRLTEIIDAIVRKYPDAVIDEVKRRFSPIIEDENLEVEVDSAA
jgi:hypothetical protein